MSDEKLRKAEIAKIEAETEKLKAEMNEVNARLKIKWFEERFFVQAIVAGIVAAGLLTAWSVEYLEPILSKNNRIAEMEVEIKRHENELINVQHKISENKLKQELAEISRKNQELIIQTKRLEDIAEKQLASVTGANNSRLETLAQDTENSLEMLRKNRKASENQSKQLQSDIKSIFAQVCVTPTGVCPMVANPVPPNSPCYCVTAYGPIQGYSQ